MALATFEHPAGVYRLRYPADWEHLVQDEGRSCGFGPRERDDAGLWISILPVRADTEKLCADLGRLFADALGQLQWACLREDRSLLHFALKADSTGPANNGGCYWLVAGGDVVLFASTQVPTVEREHWSAAFDLLMASLEITRGDELFALRVTDALLERLGARFPARDFARDEAGRIRSGEWLISPANLIRGIRRAPARRDELIDEFIRGLVATGDDAPAAAHLEAVGELILPLPKPAGYLGGDSLAAHAVRRPWLGAVVICYVIRGARTFRLILEPDLARWGADREALHRLALANLRRLPMPELPAASDESGGRLIVLSGRDHLDAARLLDPRLHDVVAPVLGSPFGAGVPDRDTLVLFPAADPILRSRLSGTLRSQFHQAAYPVSPEVFAVSPSGVALASSLPGF